MKMTEIRVNFSGKLPIRHGVVKLSQYCFSPTHDIFMTFVRFYPDNLGSPLLTEGHNKPHTLYILPRFLACHFQWNSDFDHFAQRIAIAEPKRNRRKSQLPPTAAWQNLAF
jgi:predicted HAD superfamily phosphohydrolase